MVISHKIIEIYDISKCTQTKDILNIEEKGSHADIVCIIDSKYEGKQLVCSHCRMESSNTNYVECSKCHKIFCHDCLKFKNQGISDNLICEDCIENSIPKKSTENDKNDCEPLLIKDWRIRPSLKHEQFYHGPKIYYSDEEESEPGSDYIPGKRQKKRLIKKPTKKFCNGPKKQIQKNHKSISNLGENIQPTIAPQMVPQDLFPYQPMGYPYPIVDSNEGLKLAQSGYLPLIMGRSNQPTQIILMNPMGQGYQPFVAPNLAAIPSSFPRMNMGCGIQLAPQGLVAMIPKSNGSQNIDNSINSSGKKKNNIRKTIQP